MIDRLAGLTEDRMAVFPSRVLEVAKGSSAFIVTMFQSSEADDEQFEMQYRSLQKEFESIRKELTADTRGAIGTCCVESVSQRASHGLIER